MLAFLAGPRDNPNEVVERVVREAEPDAVLFLDLDDFIAAVDDVVRTRVARGVALTAQWIREAHDHGRDRERFQRAMDLLLDGHQLNFRQFVPLTLPCIAVLDSTTDAVPPPQADSIVQAGGLLVRKPEGYEVADGDRKLRLLDEWIRSLDRGFSFEPEPGYSAGESKLGQLQDPEGSNPHEKPADIYFDAAYGLSHDDFERLIDETRHRRTNNSTA